MLSRPPMQKTTNVGTIFQLEPFTCEVLSEEYEEDVDFGDAFQQLREKGFDLKENEYHLQQGYFINWRNNVFHKKEEFNS